MKLKDYSYNELDVGKEFSFERVISEEDVNTFSALTEDANPLHIDEEHAKTTPFGKRIVHGMLAGSLFSTLVGMVCPGKKNLYVSQSLNFKKPIFLNSTVLVKGKIKNKFDSLQMIEIETVIECDGETVIDGIAKVKVMS